MANKSQFKQDLPFIFEKIEMNKPVHFKRFLLGLAESGFSPSEVDGIFTTKSIGKKRYRVRINRDRFNDYQKIKESCLPKSNQEISEKSVAAATGKSHSKSASGAFCLVHTQNHQISPFCIMVDNGIPRELISTKKNVLLIENIELFLKYKKVFKFLKENVSTLSWDINDIDVIYSQGSMVLNKQYLPILNQYDKVYCLFDLDFGGYITFIHLSQRLEKTEFLSPFNLQEVFDKYGFRMNKEELSKTKNLYSNGRYPKGISRVMEVAIKTGLKIEQEVYLLEVT